MKILDYLTISRRRQGDYESEATNCFIINFQVTIMILYRKFCVYLHFTPLFTSLRDNNYVIITRDYEIITRARRLAERVKIKWPAAIFSASMTFHHFQPTHRRLNDLLN